MLAGDNAKAECADCKAVDAKRQELESRYNSMYYTAQGYDRQKGKGAFKKEFSGANRLMESLLKEKTLLVVNHQMEHAKHELGEEPEEEEMEEETGVPII
jgi:hypothetical protein